MKKTINTNAIVFAQVKDNAKVVTANKYVAHALYTQNKALVEQLGGTVLKGVGGFQAEFKTEKNAKKFVATAITHIDADDYAKARKTEPKATAEKKASAPTKAKGKKADDLVTVTLADGTPLQVKASALGIATEPKKAPRKSKGTNKPTTAPKAKAKAPTKAKGNAELTPNAEKTLARMKMSVLNRAASAYSIANGGTAVNFDTLGKTEKDLKAYIPKAKADLLKSDKWAKAVAMGITEDMLSF